MFRSPLRRAIAVVGRSLRRTPCSRRNSSVSRVARSGASIESYIECTAIEPRAAGPGLTTSAGSRLLLCAREFTLTLSSGGFRGHVLYPRHQAREWMAMIDDFGLKAVSQKLRMCMVRALSRRSTIASSLPIASASTAMPPGTPAFRARQSVAAELE